MNRFFYGLLAGIILCLLVVTLLNFYKSGPTLSADWYGRFIGDVNAKWLIDGRKMQLNENFAYSDPKNKLWLAQAGSVIDGASIPQAFWSVIGGPFEGQFRDASVIHDVACEEKVLPSADVHRMFYFACRCGGVGETKAKMMYWAVEHFGPQWKVVYETRVRDNEKPMTVGKPVDIVEPRELSEQEAKAAIRYFETHNPSLDEIPALDVMPAN
jgi:hypothetical protein